jgi:hypothetical protein
MLKRTKEAIIGLLIIGVAFKLVGTGNLVLIFFGLAGVLWGYAWVAFAFAKERTSKFDMLKEVFDQLKFWKR